MIDASTRTVIRQQASGNDHFFPPSNVSFDEGLIGRMASQAWQGGEADQPPYEVEPLPLADGGALVAALLLVLAVVLAVGLATIFLL